MQTIREGSTGQDVVDWQHILGVTADGSFGPKTKEATIAWQKSKNLIADGVVGPATWAAAFPRTKEPLKVDPNNVHVKAKAATDKLGLTPNEGLFVRSVAWHETNYGLGWKQGEGAGSFNMGAITTTKPDALAFQHKDSRNDTGKVITYTTWFKGYPSFQDGMKGLADFVLRPNVKAALKKGDFKGATDAMYANKYYLGIHPRNTPEGNAANMNDYYNAVNKAFTKISSATGEAIQKGLLSKVLGFVGLGIVLLIGGAYVRSRY